MCEDVLQTAYNFVLKQREIAEMLLLYKKQIFKVDRQIKLFYDNFCYDPKC